jgi:hypothetical protein
VAILAYIEGCVQSGPSKKDLPSLIIHEPALEVRFVRRAAATTSYLAIRESPGDAENAFASGKATLRKSQLRDN